MQDLRAPMWCTSFLENERVSRTRRADTVVYLVVEVSWV